MIKEKLIELLKDITQEIEEDDSFEGSLRYEAFDRESFKVSCFIRTGNSQGQGGALIINEFEEEPEEKSNGLKN